METKGPTVYRGFRTTIFPINYELIYDDNDLIAEMHFILPIKEEVMLER
jgi:hypothetical protein